MSSLLHQCLKMSNTFLKFSKFWLCFWTIWTEKRKKKILEIISECHEMARNAKKNFWKFSKFWLSFWTIWTEKRKNFFWKSSQNIMKWQEMQKNFFGNLTAYQLLGAVKLSQKNFTSQIDWGIANLTLCQKSICLVEFEIAVFWQLISC